MMRTIVSMCRKGMLFAGGALLAVTLAALPARAVQDEETFAALRADLEHRLDNELAAPDGKTAKKQQKAVQKCLKALDASSSGLSADIKSAAKCAGALRKPFADEFSSAGKLADFGDTFADLTDTLTSDVTNGVADVENVAATLSDKASKKVLKQSSKATKNLDAAAAQGADYKKRLSKLASAAKALEKAQKAADKGLLGGRARSQQMVFVIDGEAFTSRSNGVLTQFFRGDDGLTIQGVRDRADGGEDELKILVSGVPGRGRYALTELPNVQITYTEKPNGAPNVLYSWDGAGGVLVVDEYDADRGSFRTQFAFSVENGTEGTRVITSGATDMSVPNVLGSGGSLFN